MLNGRLYRAAFVPFLLVLAVAAFSLGTRPLPLTSTLTPEAFEGGRAIAELHALAGRYPDRRPGSAGDAAVARYVAHSLESYGGAAAGGYNVRTVDVEGQTIDGEKSLQTVIAQRPGSTGESPIVIIAHRDAAAAGSQAELSGTAALLELARVFAARATRRPVVLVSTSGGTGGHAGAEELPAQIGGPIDAAIVLGDVAGAQQRSPSVIPYSEGYGSAPLILQRTIAGALTQQTGRPTGEPSTLGQLVHLIVPLAVGEQGVLDQQGVPAVTLQASGERGPSPTDPVSAERMSEFGRAALSSAEALDAAPDVPTGMEGGLVIQHRILPEWALRMLLLTLLIPPLIAIADGLARARRRRLSPGRWALWTLSCAAPFLLCALFVSALAGLGVISAAPAGPLLSGAMPLDGSAVASLAVTAAVLLASWLAWAVIVARRGPGRRPDPEIAGLSMMLVLLCVALLVALVSPLTALLLVPALHLWLLFAAPELRPGRLGGIALLIAGLLPLVLLLAFYSRQLGLGPGQLAWGTVLLVAGGQVGIVGSVVWSVALGCAAAAGLLAIAPHSPPPGVLAGEESRVTIRGPISYAGPGSLGGTESALRRYSAR